ncbi:MAG: hypothetical protein R3302_05745 [Sulfurimonadaceae bacterium]|nr:hypothetical protein [Sulfurimonadaceae bacterium]
MNLLRKVKRFFSKPAKKQLEKREKLEEFISKLQLKAKSLQKRIESAEGAKKRERLVKEHKAVNKLLRKSRRQLEELNAEAES